MPRCISVKPELARVTAYWELMKLLTQVVNDVGHPVIVLLLPSVALMRRGETPFGVMARRLTERERAWHEVNPRFRHWTELRAKQCLDVLEEYCAAIDKGLILTPAEQRGARVMTERHEECLAQKIAGFNATLRGKSKKDPLSYQLIIGHKIRSGNDYRWSMRFYEDATGVGEYDENLVATAVPEQEIVTGDSGRPINVVAVAPTFKEAVARVYEGVGLVHFDGAQYRTDIGQRAIEAEQQGDSSL